MNGEEHDLLIELKTDMKYVRQGVDDIRRSDAKQWERIDEHQNIHTKASATLNWLVWGQRFVITVIIGVAIFILRGAIQ